jgi:hypothetical protein
MMHPDFKVLFEYRDGVLYWKNPRARRCKSGDAAGSVDADGYLVVGFTEGRYPVHKIVWAMHHGQLPDLVDHINGDRQDNRIENLRAVTKRENNFNKRVRSDNSTGITGVRWHSQRKKWNARIKVDGVDRSLGMYKEMRDAERARLAAELKYFGEYSPNHAAIMALVAAGDLTIAPADPAEG